VILVRAALDLDPPAYASGWILATIPGLLIKMGDGVSLTFCPSWPQTAILLLPSI
jgi:hypothetical protein